MNRRSFVQRLGLTAAGGFALNCAGEIQEETAAPEPVSAGLGLTTVGLQLYTLRSIMADDFEGPVRKAVEIGYKEFELAGHGNLTPKQIRSLLDELNVRSPAAHIGSNLLRSELDEVIEDALVIGHDYVICPHPGDEPYATIDDYKSMAEFFNAVGMKCKDAGVQFAYHNHSFEFEEIDGIVPFDVLMDETDAELVAIELDLCWIVNADKDPIAYFKKYPGRFHLCHVKDLTNDRQMRDVGQGDIDFASIFAQSSLAGLKHYVVEHDQPDDPIQSIANSFQYLTGT